MRFYLPTFVVVTFLVIGVNAGCWLGICGSRKGKKEPEDYQQKCRRYNKYLFDTNFLEKIDPSTFHEYAQFLNSAYESGKFNDPDYYKEFVASWLELPQLVRCTQYSYKKFEVAKGRSFFFQNASAYVKYHLDLFEKKCLDLAYQEDYRPPEGSRLEGGPWPTNIH